MQVKRQQLELDMKQWTGSKLRKEYVKAVYCHLAYLTAMQSESEVKVAQLCQLFASCEMLGRVNHKLESRFPGEISVTSDMQVTPPLGQKLKKN